MSALRIGSLCSGYGGLDLAVMTVLNADLAWCAETDQHYRAIRVVPAQAAAALPLLIRVATMAGTRLSADLTCPHEKSADAAGPGRKASRVRAPSASAVRGRSAPTAAARAPQPRAQPEWVSAAANPSSARWRAA